MTYDEPRRGTYSADSAGDRAWLARHEQTAWCVADLASQAALLAAIIGGPGARQETTIERAIVGEAVVRLLSASDSGKHHWAEEALERPTGLTLWRCNVEIAAPAGRRAVLQLFAADAEVGPTLAASSAALMPRDIGHVSLSLRAELRAPDAPLEQILGWREGAVVALPPRSLASVTLRVDRTTLAIGRLGSAGDSPGARTRALEIERVCAPFPAA